MREVRRVAGLKGFKCSLTKNSRHDPRQVIFICDKINFRKIYVQTNSSLSQLFVCLMVDKCIETLAQNMTYPN